MIFSHKPLLLRGLSCDSFYFEILLEIKPMNCFSVEAAAGGSGLTDQIQI